MVGELGSNPDELKLEALRNAVVISQMSGETDIIGLVEDNYRRIMILMREEQPDLIGFFHLRNELKKVDAVLDECDIKNGDAPHRSVSRSVRIKILAGQV